MWKSEYGEPDPFKKIGPCRIIAVKHNKVPRGFAKDKYIDIMFFEYFDLSKTTSKTGSKCNRGWLDEEIYGLESTVKYMLVDKPNGVYEIIGDIYYHGWTSGYEYQEYDCETDFRDYSIHEASFESASTYNDLETESVNVNGYGQDVHHFMTMDRLMQIYCAAISTINLKLEAKYGYFDQSASPNTYKDMSVADMENYVWMTEMQIDSSDKCTDHIRSALSELQETMKKVLEDHKKLMVQNDE